MNKSVSVFWFKRDLRLHDNEALQQAIQSDYPVLPIYIFEPSLQNEPHYDERHFRFIQQSLDDINQELARYHTQILILEKEAVDAFTYLSDYFTIKELYSHIETGLHISYQRDLAVQKFCDQQNINWKEYQNNGVHRFRKNRDQWKEQWYEYMQQPQINFKANRQDFVSKDYLRQLELQSDEKRFEKNKNFQPGGRSNALKYAKSFFEERIINYNNDISKPGNQGNPVVGYRLILPGEI